MPLWGWHVMTTPDPQSLTSLLAAVSAGEPGAGDRLWTLAYGELHKLAMARMAREAPGQTLQPTALVNEAFIRLGGKDSVCWENRRHFFGAAARAMEQILKDNARKRNALKRIGKNRGVASLCIGGGEATAVAIELA